MDKWIISKLNTLVKEVDEKLDGYDITGAGNLIESFTDELSNWYVRRNRERFWVTELTNDKIGAYTTLYKVLVTLSKVIAPFVPFMADAIYQNLVAGLDKNAPESVHLCYWPEYDEKVVDKKLEEEMDLAYNIVELGRSARNSANIKNRQPLLKMLISVDTLPEYYGNIIKEELNVKEVELGAEMSEYVNFDIKPNLPVLGKTYGKYIPKIKAEIAKINPLDLANKVKSGEGYVIMLDEDLELELNSENVLITMDGKEGYSFAGKGTIGVVLETTITEELRKEGILREVLSKVQTTRKDSGFEVMDNINIYVYGDEDVLSVIKANEEQIKNDTLALKVSYEENEKAQEVSINGHKIKMFVEKA